MRDFVRTTIAAGIAAALLVMASAPAAGQSAAYRPPRAPDGHADLSGIYQALNTANWDLEDHSPQAGTMWQTGAIGAEPAGESVVEGGTIPYKPEAFEKKKANFENAPHRRSRSQMLHARHSARQLHALSVSNRADAARNHVRVRIRQRQSAGQYGQAGRSRLGYLDGHQ